MSLEEDLEVTVQRIEGQLHRVVENDDDQALFIASYLHGHFDLVVSQVLAQSQHSILALDSQMRMSLQQAFDNNELIESDQDQVLDLWAQLLNGRQ